MIAHRTLPLYWWQAYMWTFSATLMTLAYHGVNDAHMSFFVAAWFVGVAALWTVGYVHSTLEARRAR